MPFSSITVARSYEQVALQIEQRITSGRFAEGEKLPTEKELGEQFGVSRSVIREAIRTLHALGLVESRQGSGSYVRHRPGPLVSRALTLSVVPDRDDSVLAFYDLRELIETRTAYDAARLRTPAQLAVLEAALAADLAAASPAAADNTNERLHLAISEAAGNPYLTVLVGGIVRMQYEVFGVLMRPRNDTRSHVHHRNIVEAIAARDPDAAAVAIRAHIHEGRHQTENLLGRRKAERNDSAYAADA